MPTQCQSCGADDDLLVAVHRRYLAIPGGEGEDRVLPEIEHWCVACLTHYPHELAETD